MFDTFPLFSPRQKTVSDSFPNPSNTPILFLFASWIFIPLRSISLPPLAYKKSRMKNIYMMDVTGSGMGRRGVGGNWGGVGGNCQGRWVITRWGPAALIYGCMEEGDM